MNALNPFDIGAKEIGSLTPRRKEYIRERNIAQDQRISDAAGSISHYTTLIDKVRARYGLSELEDQCLIKPYLTILYFELGQLFEAQGKRQEALNYYEQAGIYGHLMSIENAKRLGSKFSFNLAKEASPSKLDYPIDELAIFETLHKNTVLIDGKTQKGSGIVVRENKLGNILVTVKHVAEFGEMARLKNSSVFLDKLTSYDIGPITIFLLGNLHGLHGENLPAISMDEQLKIGEKVYFGGYPFNKTDVHLHTGRVSSIGRNGEFSIDGVAVSGMSGGPIAIEREGKFYVVGTIASETFDPIEGFSKALNAMYLAQSEQDIRYKEVQEYQASESEKMRNDPQFTKIPRGSLCIGRLGETLPLNEIWEDLNKQGVILEDGTIALEKVISGQLGLRPEFRQYEEVIMARLEVCANNMKSVDLSEIDLPFEWQMPNDSVNTVSLSLVQSLSTGLITGNLFQGFYEKISGLASPKPELLDFGGISSGKESTEFEISKKNRIAKANQKHKKEADKRRAEAKEEGTFQNTGLPPLLYRYVSKEDAKDIKKNGIVHVGGDLEEIPFLTKPQKGMAQQVGAKVTEKMLTIYIDRIPGLSADNVRKVSERSGVITYRINTTIPAEAIAVSEA